MSACLKFFAVASIDAWRQRYGQALAVYRTSKSDATQQGALACWLRRAETQAASITCRTYEAKAASNKNFFISVIAQDTFCARTT